MEDLKKLHRAETEIKSNLKQLGAKLRASHAFTQVPATLTDDVI